MQYTRCKWRANNGLQIQNWGWDTRKSNSELHPEHSLPTVFRKGDCNHFWSGIFLASIVAFIFSGMRPCDLTDVERQILELQTQVDERCSDQ